MQCSKEYQVERRKPSKVINAKKQRKTIEWERLDISSRKLVITKGKFHANMGKIKDRNGMDLREAEDILKKGGKNTLQNYTKKIFMAQITTMM